jgi:hypothetical protein
LSATAFAVQGNELFIEAMSNHDKSVFPEFIGAQLNI